MSDYHARLYLLLTLLLLALFSLVQFANALAYGVNIGWWAFASVLWWTGAFWSFGSLMGWGGE